jgi:hypothetical protein
MDHFKTCSKCSHTWRVRDDFLEDPSICLVGFQASFVESEPGYYLFNHILDGDQCNTTLMVKVEDFLSLHKGSMFTDIKFETAQCEGHCTHVGDLSKCSVECKNSVAREIMQEFSPCTRDMGDASR